jgi:hypothetical protein
MTIDPVDEAKKWIEYALIDFDTMKKTCGYRQGLPKSPALLAFDDATRMP